MHCILTTSKEYQDLKKQVDIDDRTLKAVIAVWQEDNGLDKFPTMDDLNTDEFLQAEQSAIPLKGNEKLYKHYNLLNEKGAIKTLSWAQAESWMKTLNSDNVPYRFKHRQTEGGQKILIYPKNTLFQQTSTEEKPIKELEDLMIKFLDKIGVSIDIIPEGDFIAKAKIINKIIQVVQGKADISTLPEEASHFFTAILKANGSLYQRLVDEIMNTSLYGQVFEEYKSIYTLENGSPDIDKIQEEAVGKALALKIVDIYKSEIANLSLIQRAWNWVVAAIKKGLNSLGITNFSNNIVRAEGNTAIDTAARKVLNADVSGIELTFPKESYEMLQNSPNRTTQSQIVDAIRKDQNSYTPLSTKVGYETRHGYIKNAGTPNELIIDGTPSFIATQDTRKRNKYRYVSEVQEATWEKIQKRGTKVHSWIEDIIRNNLNSNKLVDTEVTKKLNSKERILYNGLAAKVEAIINDIRQKDPGAVFMPEVIVHDPRFQYLDDNGKKKYGIAGSIDLLVIHSDGTASIYDWKTTSKVKDVADVSIWKTYEYNIQIALYKRILMNGNLRGGIPKVNGIQKSRLVQIETTVDSKEELDRVNLIGEIPIAGESTGNRKLDLKLATLYERFHKMMKTKPPSEASDRAEFYDRIQSIKDTIVSLHLQKGYAHIIDNAENDFIFINDILNKEDITLEDLKIAKEITDLYGDLMEFADLSAITDKDKQSFKDIVYEANLASKIIDDKKMEIMQAQASKFGVDDILEPQRQLGFMSKNFRSISQQNHPLIITLYEMVKEQLYKTEQESNKLREDIIRHQEVLKKWASARGLSLQGAYDMIINKKSGNLIQMLSHEYYEARKEALDKDNKKWFTDNIELDVERYNKGVEQFTKNLKEKAYYKNPKNQIRLAQEIEDFKSKERNLITSRYTKIKDSKLSDWKSAEWNILEKEENKPLKEFYEFFTSSTKELSAWLPAFGYKNNFIPSVMKTYMEQISKMDSKVAVNLYKTLVNKIGINNLNTSSGNVNETTGEIGGQIPVYFTQGLKSTEKSYDLGRILQIFGEMSYNFRNMSEIETSALAGLDVIRGMESMEASSFNSLGVKINPATQDVKFSKEANKEYVELYKDYLDYFFYGIKTKNPSKFTQAIDMLNQYTAFKMLGLNPFPAIAATIANISGTQIQIGRNVYFNNAQYAKAMWMLTGGGVMDRDSKDITHSLLQLFDPLIDVRQQAKDRKLSTSILVNHVTVDHFFVMMRKPDEISQRAVFLAMLQNSMFDDTGKIVLISEYLKTLRPEGYYKLSKEEREAVDKKIKEDKKDIKSVVDLCSIKDGKLVIEGHPEIDSKVVMDYRQMVRQVNKNIIGNLDPNDYSAYKNIVWMRALMVFRNWMPRAIDERYGELRYNRELNKAEWGRYRTFLSNFFKFYKDEAGKTKWTMLMGIEEVAKLEYIKQMSIRPELTDKISETEFIDLFKENMGAQWRGLTITLGVLLLMILGGRYYDDDEDLSSGEKYMQKIIRRGYSELAMFISPTQALSILKSPSAATAPLTDFMRIIEHTGKQVLGATMGDDDMMQEARPLKYLANFNPFAGVEKTYRLFDSDWEEWIEDNKKSE